MGIAYGRRSTNYVGDFHLGTIIRVHSMFQRLDPIPLPEQAAFVFQTIAQAEVMRSPFLKAFECSQRVEINRLLGLGALRP